jgi:ribosomal protein S12
MPVVFLQQVNITDFLEVEGNVKVDSTGYLQLPVGTTAQRPSSANAGMIRYNSTSGKVEAYVPGKEGALQWTNLH